MPSPMLLAALLAVSGAPTQPLTPSVAQVKNTKTPPIKVPYEKFTLPNGMKVIFHVDKTLPTATINTWYYVGSKDEPERRSGFAHLFEHLMFMGTNRVPTGQFDKIMEKGGGANNASTSEDRTNYYSFGPSELLPTLLWLDADRLEDLPKAMDLKKLDLQRDVVKNERRQNVENEPYGKSQEAINGLMFPPGHPYHTSVIGSHEDLTAASVNDVVEFFNRFYVPSNASLVVAGNFDPKEIKPMVEKYFGTLPRGNDVVRKPVPNPTLTATKRITMVDTVPQTRVTMVWHSPVAASTGDAAMEIIGNALAGGISSRLYKSLVQESGLATDVQAYQESRLLGSLFTISASLAPGASVDKLEALLDKEIAAFAKSGPTPGEVSRMVAKVEARVASTLQSIDQKADMMNQFEFYYGNPDSFEKMLDSYRSHTPSSVKSVAGSVLNLNQRLVLRVVPEIATPAENPRDFVPAASATLPFSAPKPQEKTLKNGLPVQLWTRVGVPMVDLLVTYPLGTLKDPVGKEGLTAITGQMLMRGASNRTGAEFEDALADLGADMSVGADPYSVTVSLSVPVANAEKAVALLRTALTTPKLGAKEFEQLKDETIAGLEQSENSPQAVARLVGSREFFGPNNGLSRPDAGSTSSVKTLTIDDVKQAWARITAVKPTVYVASGIPSDQALALVDAQLGTMKVPAVSATSAEASPALTAKPRLLVVDRPGAVQTVVNFWLPAVPFGHPDRLALEAVTTALGGSFTSRLNNNLREDKGYTYGAGARYRSNPVSGWLFLSSSVRADVTGASIKEFLKELDRMEKGDLTDEEVKKVQQQLRTDRINAFQSLGAIVSTAASYDKLMSDLGRVDADLADLPKLTRAQLNTISQTYFKRSGAMVVLVGDKKTILEQIQGLGLPAPEIVKL